MTIPPWAVRGAKVVCVTSFWEMNGIDGPAMREICTISSTHINAGGQPCLRFDEHEGWWDDEMAVRHGYSPRCFRPIVTRTQEQDAEAFAPLLLAKELADADQG